MEEYFYLDTSIWIDYLEKRGKNGKLAYSLIKKIVLSNKIIIFSKANEHELKQYGYSTNEINKMLYITKPRNLIKIQINKQEHLEAKRLRQKRNVSYGDAIHAILAHNNFATFIALDSDFNLLKDIINARRPKDYI